MAEQLTLQQVVSQGGAVDRHHRFIGTLARFVNGSGGQLLTGAAFTANQHRGRGRTDLLNHVQDSLGVLIIADDAGVAYSCQERARCQFVLLFKL